MNRKYYIKNRRRFCIFLIATFLITSCILYCTNGNISTAYSEHDTIVVKSGDTLWDIAKQYNNKGDIRDYIHRIEKLNNLSGCDIYEGDVLLLPL